MRQGQQNRRGRGRNNNRKGQSPLTRSFESTGPDVKIRGTPAHIGEKYMSLARDASVAGDPVLAENYLQHAEHYNRIIMAAREQFAQQGGDMNGGGRFKSAGSDGMEGGDEYGDDELDDYMNEPQPAPRAREPQPRLSETAPRADERPYRRGSDYTNRPPRGDRFGADMRGAGSERTHSGERAPMSERQPPGDRPPMTERAAQHERPVPPAAAEQPAENFAPPPRHDAPPRRRERYQPPQRSEHEQPEFLRRPVRRPRREAGGAEPETGAASEPAVAADDPERE